MHIPDGFLDLATAAITYVISLLYGFYALRKARVSLSGENVPLISVLAAGIFAAQMLNWPIPGGTSLHFVGGALAGILLGPWLGFLPMLLVLLVQCLIFHDGGITALGANILNMAVIAVLLGYSTYRVLIRAFGAGDRVRATAGFLGGWLGIALAGAACGLEIGYSPSFPYGIAVTVPIMAGWHLILGVVEGAITALTILYISRRAPQLISSEVGLR
ncbi:MAG: energy-coupling factor ABC transporter permease [Candidatus Bathyarchaeia archaeon]